MQKKFKLLILTILIFAAETSLAVKEVIFRQQTHIYAKKSENSEVLGVYDRGDAIPISNKNYGPWRKVIVDVGGKKKMGWVLTKDIKGAKLKDSGMRRLEENERKGVLNYRARNGVGLLGSLSYVYQTSGDIQFDFGGAQTATYSNMSGANVFLGVFGDFNYSPTMAIRGYLATRNMKRSGSVVLPSNETGNFTLTHELLALGTVLKFYKSPTAIFWWGPGLEIAKTTKFSAKGSTSTFPSIEGNVSEDPLYALVTLNAGYDFNLSGRFFVLPEAKIGVVPNGDPMVITFEILIPVAYTF